MVILGISAFYHDSAAALVIDGQIVAAAQEERFTRVKNDARFPEQAIRYCLEEAGLLLSDVDHVVFYEKPFIKFDRLIENYLAFAPSGFRSFAKSIPLWLGNKLWMKADLQQRFPDVSLLFSEHHVSHGASAYYPSPFERAAVLTCDGVGEWTTTSIGVGEGKNFRILKTIRYPHSLGLLYSAFTYFTGFNVNSGEYKMMGLAPFGDPVYADVIKRHLILILADGSFQLNMNYFDYPTNLKMTNRKFACLFGVDRREPESPIRQVDMDLAASIQKVTEEVVLNLANAAHRAVGGDNLCLAGGVALNCVANGRLLREGPFKNIWVQPAAGDAGGALGAALYVSHHVLGLSRSTLSESEMDRQKGSYLGPAFSTEEAKKQLEASGAQYEVLSDDEIVECTARELASGKIVGWVQGRMEFGPRALGSRSILGSPLMKETQASMNLKVKFRESFRPFAPSVLEEDVSEYFDLGVRSPYMLFAAPVAEKHLKQRNQEFLRGEPTSTPDLLDRLNQERSFIPSVTHVDFSARIQTVSKDTNPRYHALIRCFKELTGCALIVNTSFNVRGEPIVCSPEDAYRCFMRTEMDYLVIENLWIDRSRQRPLETDAGYEAAFALDERQV